MPNYRPVIIKRMIAINTTVPRLTPTTSHRAQLGMDGFNIGHRYYYSTIILLIDAVLFYHFIYRLIHGSLCNIACILCGSPDVF